MRHIISKKEENTNIVELCISENIEKKTVLIAVERLDHDGNFIDHQAIDLEKKDLHSLIGVLLHVQSKIK